MNEKIKNNVKFLLLDYTSDIQDLYDDVFLSIENNDYTYSYIVDKNKIMSFLKNNTHKDLYNLKENLIHFIN